MKKTTLSATPTTEYDNLDPALGQAHATEGTSLNNGILYLGKQQDLYLYARLGWRNYLPHQLVFKAFSPYYTEALAAEQLALIELTEALPDQEARVVEPLDAKDELVGLNTNVLQKFMDGKLYIERTYTDPTKQATMLRAAGDNYYKAAFDKNWSSTASLISAFKQFLDNYGQELKDSNQMPPDFPAEFKAVSNPFLTLWQSYKDKWVTAHQERSVKFDNNNLIYKELANMCEVGKMKFAKTPTIKKMFTITALLNEVSGHSPSGVRGMFNINGNKNHPVANANISVVGDPERFAISDATGRYELRLPSGDYTLRGEAAGFAPQTITKTIKIGVMSRLSVALVPVVVEVVEMQPAFLSNESKHLSKSVQVVNENIENGVAA